MAYQVSTTIASNQALIDAICTFAAANGWTVDRNDLTGSNRVATMHIAGVTDYVHLYNEDADLIYSRLSVGYDAGDPPDEQPDQAPASSITNQLTGPYPSVWFFADGNELDVVVRRGDTAGAYAHLAFGRIQKYGTFDGGTYADGTYFPADGSFSGAWVQHASHGVLAAGYSNAGYMRVDADSLTNRFLQVTGTPANTNPHVNTGAGALDMATLYAEESNVSTMLEGYLVNSADDNVFSGRSVFQPIEFSAQRTGSPPYFSPIGYVANRRYASLAKFDPEQEVTVGGDTWVVFPVVRKAAQSNVVDALNATGNNGYAIRKVT